MPKEILKGLGIGLVIDLVYIGALLAFDVFFALSNQANQQLINSVTNIVNKVLVIGVFVIPVASCAYFVKAAKNRHP